MNSPTAIPPSRACGTGASCEQTCPLMRLGRVCPDFHEFMDEMRALVAGELTPCA